VTNSASSKALLTPKVAADELSTRIGAVNTLRCGPSGWEGRNFDVAGSLRRSPRARCHFAGRWRDRAWCWRRRSAAVAGLHPKARMSRSRRRPRSGRGARRANLARDEGISAAGSWDLLVQHDAVGMWPRVDESPLAASAFGSSADGSCTTLSINPRETRLARAGPRSGATAVGGLEMLVGQACHQFRVVDRRKHRAT